jgi:hypothetical protein
LVFSLGFLSWLALLVLFFLFLALSLPDIMDLRGHRDSFGSVYAIQDTAISLGFALGPLLGAGLQHALEKNPSKVRGKEGAGGRWMTCDAQKHGVAVVVFWAVAYFFDVFWFVC